MGGVRIVGMVGRVGRCEIVACRLTADCSLERNHHVTHDIMTCSEFEL